MLTTCLGCGMRIEVPDLLPMKVINTTTVSLIIVEHPQQTDCPNCKQPTVIGVLNANVSLAAKPMSPEEQKPIILTPHKGMQVHPWNH